MSGSTLAATPDGTTPRSRRHLVAALAGLSILCSMVIATSPAEAATSTLAPASITTTAGSVGSGQVVANLAAKDQSGTQDTWAKYVEFSPSGSAAYAGYRSYSVASSVAPSSVTGIAVSVNYRGPSTANQTWTWSLYNWTTSSWTSVGTNATAPSWGSWKSLSFTGPATSAAPSYVSSTGAIRVRLGANNTSDSADVDFESVTVTSGAAVADTTAPSTPTGLTSPSKTATSVTLAWAASTDAVSVTGYEVFRGTGTTPVATVTAPSATVTGLTASTAYSFTIKARDAAGNRSGASAALAVTTSAASGGGSGYTLPPANGKFDYQLGGSYTPLSNVAIVSRDRTSTGVAGKYNICYVNLLQTQPNGAGDSTTNPPYGTTRWWDLNHPELLLRTSSGQLIIDPDWDEAIFDVSTAAKRTALAAIQKPWFDGCKASGFQAIEPDNLDAETRQGSTLTHTNIRDYLKIMVPYAHSIGLAIGQKNAVSEDEWFTDGPTFVNTVSPAQGFDFAIAEECQEWGECGVYTGMYGGRVYEIEYTTANFTAACSARGSQISVIDRDLDVVPSGSAGYRYSEC